MVDITEQYLAAFVAMDGDGVASLMVHEGSLAMTTVGDRIVSDTHRANLRTGPWRASRTVHRLATARATPSLG